MTRTKQNRRIALFSLCSFNHSEAKKNVDFSKLKPRTKQRQLRKQQHRRKTKNNNKKRTLYKYHSIAKSGNVLEIWITKIIQIAAVYFIKCLRVPP